MDADGKNKRWIASKSMRDIARFRTGGMVDLYTRNMDNLEL